MSLGSSPAQFRLSHLHLWWSFTQTPLSRAGEVMWTSSVCQVTGHTPRNSHQQVGARSGFSCSFVLCTLSEGQGNFSLLRQHDSCLLRQQGGGSSVHTSLCPDRRNVTLVPDPGGFSLSQTHSRQTKHCSRCPQPFTEHSPH